MEVKENAAAYCEAQLREIRTEAESLNRMVGKLSDQAATEGSQLFLRNLRLSCEETEKLATELSARICSADGVAAAPEERVSALNPELLF